MRTVLVHKAEAILDGDEEIESVRLEISAPLERIAVTADNYTADTYAEDARAIADALESALPQGTRHRLLGELLARHSNLYRGL